MVVTGCRHSLSVALYVALLMHHPGKRGDDNAGDSHQHAKVPEYSSAGEQRDRGDHQGDLHEHFREIEAVRLAAGKFGLIFGFAGLAVEIWPGNRPTDR